MAYGFKDGSSQTFAFLVTQPAQGRCEFKPTTRPSATLDGEGTPNNGGLVWVSQSTATLQQFDAQGAVVGSWGGGGYQVIPSTVVGATDRYAAIVGASATRLLVTANARAANMLWRGFALVDRANGAQVARIDTTAMTLNGKLRPGTAPDGTSYVYVGDFSYLRISADGAQQTLTGAFGLAENETKIYGRLAFLADSSLIVLVTNTETQLERIAFLNADLTARQPTVVLDAPKVAEDSMWAESAFVDAKRRVVVWHQYDDDSSDPTIVNAGWMIRRYWLP